MYFKTRSGRLLYYETKKGNSGKTLVLLNGLTQSTMSWALMEPKLNNHSLVLMDFIFQGKSEKTGEWQNFNEHAVDVADLLDNIGLKSANIAGLSYGSLVAQHFAVLFPEKLDRLILMSSFCYKTPYYIAIEAAWENAIKIGGYPLMLDVMLPTVLSENYFNSPIIPIELMKQARTELNQDSSALIKLMQATKARGDYRKELNKINSPTLIIHGEKDLLFPVHMGKAVAENINGSKFVLIEGAGHTLNLEGIIKTCETINDFISH
ncbi:MAG: alpha/beta fold hydrolase [Bacteroidota bacterium]|jgi:3-oxoadipate enol-lactonase